MSAKTTSKKPSQKIDMFSLAEELTSNMGVGIYIVQKGKFVYISPLYTKLTGYSDPELIGKNSLERIHPDDREMVRENAIKSLKGKSTDSYEYRYIRKDGALMWILETIIPTVYNGERAALGSFMDITRRKQLENDLQKSEQRYRNILENIYDGYFELDLEGNYTFVNEANCRLLGYTKDELLGMNSRKHLDEKIHKKLYKSYYKLYETGVPIESLEVRATRKDGARVIYETSVSLIRDDKGRPIGFRGISRDVTERKKMEELILKSEERYRTVIEEIEEGYYEIDLNGNFTFVNDAICKTLGYSHEELIGLNFKAYVPAEQQKDVFEIFLDSYETGKVKKWFPLINIRKDGTRLDVEDSIAPLRDKEGKITGFKGVTRDITQRKRMEEALQKSEEYFKEITENSSDVIIITDKDGKIKYCSRSVERFSGYTPEELIGVTAFNFIHQDDLQRAAHDYSRAIQLEDAVIPNEFRLLPKDGSVRLFEGLGKNLLDNPSVAGFVMNIRDITERKQIEAQKEAALEKLKESEEKYRTILEDMDEGYFELDIKGTFTFVNDAECRNTGYPKEEFIGMHYTKLVDKDNAKKMFQTFNELYRTGKPIRLMDVEIFKYNGEKAFYETSVSLARDKDEKPIGFRGVSRDVTQRRQMEETIRQSEEKYRTILETMQESYFEVDLAGNLTYVNPAMHTGLGFAKEELIGKHYSVFTDEANVKALYKIYNNIYKTGEPVRTVDFEFIKKDKTTLFAETSASPIRNAAGKIIGFRGVSHDVTERRKMEETIRQSEERYRTIIDEVDEWYFEIDLAGNVVFINDAVVRSTGLTLERLIGLNYKSFIDNENADEVYKIFRQVYDTSEPTTNFPFEFIRPNGTVTFFDLSVFPKLDSQGKVIGFRGVGHDITQRKRTEEQLNYIATHDLLTGLPNRMLLMDRLKMAVAQAKRNEQKLALMMMDLDNFKSVNDSFGHMVGDELLKEISLRLTTRLRKNDTLSRLGGDEFILLLPAIERNEDALEVAKIILESFQHPFICDGHSITATISIGVAVYPDDAHDVDILMKNADIGMYHVKAHGRNGYHFFSQADNGNHAGQSLQ
ncbi:MAG TPA: PAS domain S-box protein [Deltaproteobacteria bacterium]|nr:PAS domain S-box protein [Deltaproteobacteria bacterium]